MSIAPVTGQEATLHDPPTRRYSAAAAARLLGCSETTIAHYIRRYRIREHRPGQRYHFTEEEVAQLRHHLAARLPLADADKGER